MSLFRVLFSSFFVLCCLSVSPALAAGDDLKALQGSWVVDYTATEALLKKENMPAEIQTKLLEKAKGLVLTYDITGKTFTAANAAGTLHQGAIDSASVIAPGKVKVQGHKLNDTIEFITPDRIHIEGLNLVFNRKP